MKKMYLLSAFALLAMPLFGVPTSAAGLHIAAGLPNYPLIIACVVGGSLAVFLLAMFAMKYKRKSVDPDPENNENNAENDNTAEDNNND